MKILFAILFCFVFLSAYAQNYQCLQAGVKHYFTNSNGYLRGIRIDSIKIEGDSTIYYPYHTPRGYYATNPNLDSTGGSWLGKAVVQRNDGTFIFDNLWRDTVLIRTQANVGDSWVFYKDTTALYYQADLIAEDTMTVLGLVDSMKRILITARNGLGIVTTDPVDSFQIILSKSNGFAQVFDLFTFPYHGPDAIFASGIDFYLDLVSGYSLSRSSSIFSLIDIIDPSYKELYKWDPGDVYEYSMCNGTIEYSASVCDPAGEFDMDTIISADTLTATANYNYSGWKADINYSGGFSTVLTAFNYATYSYTDVLNNLHFDSTLLIDTVLMPEEFKQRVIYSYFPNDSSYCFTNTLYSLTDNIYIRAAMYNPPFEVYAFPSLYKSPLGLLRSEGGSVDDGFIVNAQQLLYYKHDDIVCGSAVYPSTEFVDNVAASSSMVLSPNPVISDLTIFSNMQINSVSIYDLLGREAYKGKYYSEEVTLNLNNLSPGIYILKINGVVVKKFAKN